MNNQFRKTPLAAAVSVAIGASTQYVYAESSAPSEAAMEEVVVTGIRSSLMQSMNLKRDATGVVDAISAEDIGDFPDSNLAESLQRITGVSVDRERGEGARVTVRGFGPSFNLVTLNGRQMPTSSDPNFEGGTGRSFDFGNLASEGISAVEVYKSGRADVPTGGIGSTINAKSTRPLSSPGLNFTVAGSMLRDESIPNGDATAPEISGLFSNTFADDTIGVALSVVRQERESGAATASVGGWRTFTGETDNCWCGAGPSEWGGIPPEGDPNQVNRPGEGDIYSVPQVISYELAEFDRTRTNGQLTFQYRFNEDMVGTLDYTYSELELSRTYTAMGGWFNFGGQSTLWTDGPNASPLTYSEALPGSDFAMNAGQDAFRTENKSVGMNLVWDVSDNLSMEFDYHDSSADREPNSPFGNSSNLGVSSFTRDVTTGYFGQELPILELTLSRPLSPQDMIVTGSVFANNIGRMDIEQGRVSGTFDFDPGSFVESIDFGVQITEVNNRTAGSVVQRDAWGGVTQPGAVADLMTPASMAGAFGKIPGGNDPRLQVDYFTFDMAEVIARTEALQASGDAVTFMVPDMGDCGTGLCASSDFSTDRRTQEDTQALYVQANMYTEFMEMPVNMRLGFRYENTDVASQALAPAYDQIVWVAGNEFTAVQSSEDQFTELKGDYDHILPNFDFSIDLTQDIIARASFSKTLARPNYADIQGGQTISQLVRVDGGTGNRGNPALLPFESFNIDLSFEWYYGADSYMSIGYFDKDVENFIGNAQVIENLFDLPHPALGPLGEEARAATGSSDAGALYAWILANRPDAEGVDAAAGTITGVAGRDPSSPFNLTVPVNIEKATVDGFEIALQHNFGDSGFGFIANATFADADVGYDNLSLAQQFVLNGLSDSANLIAFYDDGALNVRIAYNWRDGFLAGVGQNNVGAVPPTYTAEYSQIDMSASYWFGENFQVFADILNLTNETTHVHGRSDLQTLFAAQLGTRYNVGLRYKF